MGGFTKPGIWEPDATCILVLAKILRLRADATPSLQLLFLSGELGRGKRNVVPFSLAAAASGQKHLGRGVPGVCHGSFSWALNTCARVTLLGNFQTPLQL